jgi:hypothetical protein
MIRRFFSLANHLVWNFAFGPVLSLLPERWRDNRYGAAAINWPRAAMISGAIQFVTGPIFLLVWYSYAIGGFASQAVEKILGHTPAALMDGLKEQHVGFMGLMIVAAHPFTWVLGYFMVEGAVRGLSGAITNEAPGSLPLVALDGFWSRIAHPKPADVADLVTRDDLRKDWQLKIEANAPKRGWEIGRIVKFEKRYYRVESSVDAAWPRPAVYFLARLAAGVPSSSVIFYEPGAPQAATKSAMMTEAQASGVPEKQRL